VHAYSVRDEGCVIGVGCTRFTAPRDGGPHLASQALPPLISGRVDLHVMVRFLSHRLRNFGPVVDSPMCFFAYR
jgi:hypothetical protein